MNPGIAEITAKLQEIARENRDFDMYDASCDTKLAFGYLGTLVEDKRAEIGDTTANNILDRVKSNGKRYKKLQEWIDEENKAKKSANADMTNCDLYIALYESEQELLLSYCYATILSLLNERDILDDYAIVVRQKPSVGVVDADTPKSRERERKRAATKKAKELVNKSIRTDVLTDDEIKLYDETFNAEYQALGGTDDKALNPARRAKEKRDKKANGESGKNK